MRIFITAISGFFQDIETRVFSPTSYAIGEQRPRASYSDNTGPTGPPEGRGRKRKGSEAASSGVKVGRGKRN